MEQATKENAPTPEIAQGIGYFEQTMDILRQEGKEPKIFSKIADIMQGVQAVDKNNKNEDQNYKFRSIYDVYNEIQPLFAKARVFTSNIVLDSKEEKIKFNSGSVATRVVMRVSVWFITDDGSAMPSIVEVEGMDFGDKAYNKALSFAHKYAIMQMFSIPTKELAEGDTESLETKEGGRVGPASMNGQQKNGTPDPSKVKLSKENQKKVKEKVQNLPEDHRFRSVKIDDLTVKQGKMILKFVSHYVKIVQQANILFDKDDITQANHNALIKKAMRAEKIADLKDLADKMATITDGKKQAESAYGESEVNEPADRETIREVRKGLKHLPKDRRNIVDKELQSGDITYGDADEYLTEIEEHRKKTAE